MFWLITSIILAVIAIVTLLINKQKDNEIDALEYEVAHLLDIIFNDHGDVVLRAKDEDIQKIKDELDKRMKKVNIMGKTITINDGSKANELDNFNFSNHKYKVEAIGIENPMGKLYVRFRLTVVNKNKKLEIEDAKYLADKYLFLMSALHLEESEKPFFMAHNILEIASRDSVSHREIQGLR